MIALTESAPVVTVLQGTEEVVAPEQIDILNEAAGRGGKRG